MGGRAPLAIGGLGCVATDGVGELGRRPCGPRMV